MAEELGPLLRHPVVEVNDAVSEATLGQEIQLDLNLIGKGTLTSSDHDRAKNRWSSSTSPAAIA